jgi:chromosomal replication initiator protein
MNYLVIPGIQKPEVKPKDLLFVHPERVKAAVMMHFDKPFEFFALKNRQQEISYPRQVLIYLLRKYTHLNCRQILQMVNKKDHTNILHACEAIRNYMDTDPRRKNEINSIVENF